MSFDVELLLPIGIDVKTGLEYTGGRDKFISAMQRYYKASAGNKAKIKEYLDKGDMENLSIVVHSLKSNSRMIGATSLGTKFETMEYASRNGDVAAVREGIGDVLEEYETILIALAPLGEMDDLKAEGELNADEAKDVVKKLLDALDEFDDDSSAEYAKKLMGYPFRMGQKAKLKDAINFIGDFMYEEAAEIIKEISEEID
jgi:HPt (histidine-containing phosphotransfer) domain-containing protein